MNLPCHCEQKDQFQRHRAFSTILERQPYFPLNQELLIIVVFQRPMLLPLQSWPKIADR